jgi:hypothetical protein
MYICWSFMASTMIVTGGLVIIGIGIEGLPGSALLVGGGIWLALVLPVAFMRCRIDDDALRFRNYFRSYCLPWSGIASITTVPVRFLTIDTSFSEYPRCQLRSGETVDIRCLVRISRKKAPVFKKLIDEKAEGFGFVAEIDTLALAGGLRGYEVMLGRKPCL